MHLVVIVLAVHRRLSGVFVPSDIIFISSSAIRISSFKQGEVHLSAFGVFPEDMLVSILPLIKDSVEANVSFSFGSFNQISDLESLLSHLGNSTAIFLLNFGLLMSQLLKLDLLG